MTENHEVAYDTRVKPLMDQVMKLCEEEHIPFIAQFQLTDNNENDQCLMGTMGHGETWEDDLMTLLRGMCAYQLPQAIYVLIEIGLMNAMGRERAGVTNDS